MALEIDKIFLTTASTSPVEDQHMMIDKLSRNTREMIKARAEIDGSI
jgi:hypothetical protein